jgi:hypothetical protein
VQDVIAAHQQNRLNWAQITDRQQAIAVIKRTWDEIPQSTIDRLCRSFIQRLKMVKDAQGQTIQPLLGANKTTVPPNYLEHRPEMPPPPSAWTKFEDDLLADARSKHPNASWDKLAKLFPGRRAVELRNRYKKLNIVEHNKKWIQPQIESVSMTDSIFS